MAPLRPLLADCEHVSALRFRLPSPGADLLNVRETDEQGALTSAPADRGVRDGGIARERVCGRAPRVPEAAIGMRPELRRPAS